MQRKPLLILILLLAVLITGCGHPGARNEGKPESTTQPKAGGTFRVRISADPPTLDPAFVKDTISSEVVTNIFDGLVQYDEKLEIKPALANSWSVSPDGLVWTFNLRRGVKFHNGREMRADDVYYSFTRILDPTLGSPRAWMFLNVKGSLDFLTQKAPQVMGFRIIDDYTFEITLDRPYTPFLQVLAMPNASIVPKEEIAKYGREFAYHPTGTGAFKLKDWFHNERLILQGNAQYFEGKPFLDKIEFHIISEDAAAFNEYEQANLDLLDTIPEGQIERVLKGKEFQEELIKKPRLGLYYLGMNTSIPPLDNKKVRQAIAMAINKRAITEVLRRGSVEEATHGILPPGVPGYSPEIKALPYDVAKAKAILAEGGYPTGVPAEISLIFNTSSIHQGIAEAIRADLREIGISLRLVALDWKAFMNRLDEGHTQLFRNGWIADYPDPDNFLYVLLNSANSGPGGNASFYRNPDVDYLTNRARSMPLGDERLKTYQQVEKIVAEDVPIVPIYYFTNLLLRRPYVQGLNVTVLGLMPFKTVWISEE